MLEETCCLVYLVYDVHHEVEHEVAEQDVEQMSGELRRHQDGIDSPIHTHINSFQNEWIFQTDLERKRTRSSQSDVEHVGYAEHDETVEVGGRRQLEGDVAYAFRELFQ